MINLSFLTDNLSKNFGGTAGNIAYNLSLLGMESAILASSGKDFLAYKNFLDKNRVNTTYIKEFAGLFTANYFVVVDRRDNQIGGFYAGAMVKDKYLSLNSVKEKTDLVIISPTDPEAMIKFADEANIKNLPYMFDPGMQLPRLSNNQLEQGIKNAEILIGNDYEMALIQKRLNLTTEQILKKVRILITTLAEKGSIINNKIKIGIAKPEKIVDPVGAGDAYRAGFTAGFLKGLDLETCGQMGATVACYAVEKKGTTAHSFTKKEFCDRFKNNFAKKIEI
jgi:adenosine kinase